MPLSMDGYFQTQVLTKAVNEMPEPKTAIFQKVFRPKLHFEPSDKITFDVITGSRKILKNLSIYAPAEVRDKTDRKVITLEAPRLAQKRFIAAAELNRIRALAFTNAQIAAQTLAQKIGIEQMDMKNEIYRTLEFWSAHALSGKIYDSDLQTVLIEYNMPASHKPSVDWTAAGSNPVTDIRQWKTLIENDVLAGVNGYYAFCGSSAMDALLTNDTVLALLRHQKGRELAEKGDVEKLVDVDITEYNATYIDDNGNQKRYVPENAFILIADVGDGFDCPYAPVIDLDADKGGVNNPVSPGDFLFSKSWKENDPSGVWIKVEARPLPIVKRPAAIVYATVA